MEPPISTLPRWTLPALLVFVLVCFAVRNLPWNLEEYDQAKQAYVSFEMVQEGHWWFQHTPTGGIATKPPLAGWISAGLVLATGGEGWNFAWRFPPFAAAVALVWLLVQAGYRLGGATGAILAVGAFGLNTIAPRLATLVRTDMLLCFAIFWVGYLILEKVRAAQPWTASERWQVFAALLASMLLKGPIAYAFLLPGVVAFWAIYRGTAWSKCVWSGWWSWFGPMLFFGVWVGVGVYLSQEFYKEVVQDEFLGRFTTGAEAKHHNQAFYFYVTNLLAKCFPWSLLLLAGFLWPASKSDTAGSSYRGVLRERWLRLKGDPARWWLFCWAFGGLLVMSLVPSKRTDRIFPVIPPFCLLLAGLGAILPPALRARFESRLAVWAALGLGLLVSGGYAAFELVEGYRNHASALPEFGREVRRRTAGQPIAVVNGKDEGLLLYLHQSNFTKADKLVEDWRAGKLAGAVVPASVLQERQLELAPVRVELKSVPTDRKESQYAFIRPGN